MSHSPAPGSSRVFLIGFNQATPLQAHIAGDHDAYRDALFNRNGRSIAKLYEEAREEKGASPTRHNMNCVTGVLKAKGIADVLETNVVCYATPMSSDLADAEHRGGRLRGTAIFEALIDEIQPPILFAHGSATRQNLEKVLGCSLPELPQAKNDGVCSCLIETDRGGRRYRANVFLIPSLAPPAWNRWAGWAWPHIDMVCEGIRETLNSRVEVR
jgi:hypothetical protein